MSSIFPLRDTVSLEDREPRLVDLDEETADEVFETLASTTTRKIFLELHKSPQTASDLAKVTDTSVQNAQYHLQKLLDADLVEVVDTWYSERGSEMKVYAPQDESLVLFAGRDKQRTLRRLLNRVVGVLGVLVPSSALVGLGTNWWGPTADDGAADGADAEATGDGDDVVDDGDAEAVQADTVEDDAPDRSPADEEMEDVEDADDAADAEPTTEDLEAEYDTFTNESLSGDVSLQPPSNESVHLPNGGPEGTVEATETAASIDPLVAAALFFFGGLVVFMALSLWDRRI